MADKNEAQIPEPLPQFERKLNTPYPPIDLDPEFGRVVRYFRGEDYASWAGLTAAFPGAYYFLDKVSPPKKALPLRGNLIMCGILGTMAGFFYAYQSSSMRFWGWTENEREQKKDLVELSKRAQQGLPLYGESQLDPFYQQTAANNSRYAALKLSTLPWFNFVSHNYHGVDTSKYHEKSQE